jgi:hypothetical protein
MPFTSQLPKTKQEHNQNLLQTLTLPNSVPALLWILVEGKRMCCLVYAVSVGFFTSFWIGKIQPQQLKHIGSRMEMK